MINSRLLPVLLLVAAAATAACGKDSTGPGDQSAPPLAAARSDTQHATDLTPAQRARVEERLRALGYIE